MTIAKAACPSCGHSRTVSLPAGSERTLLIEPSEGPEPDEGGGGCSGAAPHRPARCAEVDPERQRGERSGLDSDEGAP